MFGWFSRNKPIVSPSPSAMDWSLVPGGQRKLATEQRLKARNIPVNPHLPLFVDETVVPRSGETVKNRMTCVTLVAASAQWRDANRVKELLSGHGVIGSLTKAELEFLDNPAPSEHAFIQFQWQFECGWALLWALGYIPTMGDHSATCQPPEMGPLVLEAANGGVAIPVGKEQLLDAGDELYRMHWACRDAQMQGKEVEGLMASSVVERRRAIQWLLEPEVEWDDISLDT